MSCEVAKKRADPYDNIVSELPKMRRETVELVKKAVPEGGRGLRASQQSIGGECAVDGAGAGRDVTQLDASGQWVRHR
jgi:hypothetical protein